MHRALTGVLGFAPRVFKLTCVWMDSNETLRTRYVQDVYRHARDAHEAVHCVRCEAGREGRYRAQEGRCGWSFGITLLTNGV